MTVKFNKATALTGKLRLFESDADLVPGRHLTLVFESDVFDQFMLARSEPGCVYW